MSKAPNLPWGRAAVQPVVYLAIPSYEKVLVKYTVGYNFFFHVRVLKPYMVTPCLTSSTLTIYVTGLGFRLWDSKDSGESVPYVVEGFPS